MNRQSTSPSTSRVALQLGLLALVITGGFVVACYLWLVRREFFVDRLVLMLIVLTPIPFIVLATRIWPAQPDQRIFSKGLWQDLLYFFAMGAFDAIAIAWFSGLLYSFYDNFLGFLTIMSVAVWPIAARLALSLFVTDFLNWLHHYVRHKVALFWKFHTVHHSQTEMNVFTDLRYHFLEYVIAKLIIFIPAYMLQLEPLTAFGIAIVIRWHTMGYHANLRSNYGPLRYIFVTPQSHRIHHSHQIEHSDKNFGVVFSIWDRLFGTQHPDSKSYPDTGIDDQTFPLEQRTAATSVLTNLIAQTIYPLRVIFYPASTSSTKSPGDEQAPATQSRTA